MTTIKARVLCTYLLFVVLIVSCSGNNNNDESVSPSDTLISKTDTIPNDSILLEPIKDVSVDLFISKRIEPFSGAAVEVVIQSIEGYGTDEAFARASADTLERILNSDGFQRAVENSTFQSNRGFSSKEIYNLIMKAHEENGPGGKDGVLDIRMRIITLDRDGQEWITRCTETRPGGWITVGIDGAGSGEMATCKNWVEARAKEKNYGRMAGHIIHEYMHILNFRDDDAEDMMETVPYKIASIVNQLAKTYSAR